MHPEVTKQRLIELAWEGLTNTKKQVYTPETIGKLSPVLNQQVSKQRNAQLPSC